MVDEGDVKIVSVAEEHNGFWSMLLDLYEVSPFDVVFCERVDYSDNGTVTKTYLERKH